MTNGPNLWSFGRCRPFAAEPSRSSRRGPGLRAGRRGRGRPPEQLKALGDRTRWPSWTWCSSGPPRSRSWRPRCRKPKSTVAHHVEVLRRAGLLRVVRTRQVRAVTESFYGRTGRTIHVPAPGPGTRWARCWPRRWTSRSAHVAGCGGGFTRAPRPDPHGAGRRLLRTGRGAGRASSPACLGGATWCSASSPASTRPPTRSCRREGTSRSRTARSRPARRRATGSCSPPASSPTWATAWG